MSRNRRYKLSYNSTHPTLFPTVYLDEQCYSDQGYTYTSDSSAVDAAINRYIEKSPVVKPSTEFDLIDSTIDALFPDTYKYKFTPAEEAWKKLDLTTSAGYTHPGKTKAEALGLGGSRDHDAVTRAGEIAYKMYKGFKHAGKHRNEMYPCKVALKPKCYKKGVEELCFLPDRVDTDVKHDQIIDKYKVRVIWVAPVEAAIYEQCFYQCFYDHNKKNVNSPMLMGKDAKRRVLQMSLKDSEHSTVSLDWSGFDQTVPSWLIYRVILRLVDKLTIPAEYLPDGDDSEFKREAVEILSSSFIHTCLVKPDGSVFIKHKGIPSGSAGTQLIGTICNMVVIQYLLFSEQIEYTNLCCLGDDSRFEVMLDTDMMKLALERMAHTASIRYGMELHPEKCEVNPPHGRNAFLGFASVDGREQVDKPKYEFKLRFSSQPIKSYEEELLRFVALYISGGYALESYQCIKDKIVENGYKNPWTGDYVEFRGDYVIDREMKAKFRYVFGVELGALIPKIPLILETPVELLKTGATLSNIIFTRYTVPTLLSSFRSS